MFEHPVDGLVYEYVNVVDAPEYGFATLHVPPAGLPDNVTELPAQKLAFAEVTVGNGFTVIVTVDVLLQPLAFVPVTVYVVVVEGDTETDDPVSEPGIHMYVVAPEAVSVVVVPLQIVLDDADAVTVGVMITVTVTCAVEAQPAAEVPVTVYVVVEDGLTVTLVPESEPGIQS